MFCVFVFMDRMRSKSFCFTLNNYTEEEDVELEAKLNELAAYWIIGREEGESGTPHLQGYFQLRKRAYIRQLRDLFSPRCHYEVARGTPKQNRAYCSKDGDFREGGEFPCRGKEERRNREEIAARFSDAVGRGAEAVREFAEEFPGTWYGSGFNMLRNAQLVMPPIHRPEINVQWLHGKPGVGKSRRAHEQLPEAYIKEPRTKWWNGYMYEKEVIIDDFGPGGIDINHLLRWFDRYKCMVETKGGMCALYATTFIVTSNFTPEEVYTDNFGVAHKQLPALLRRVNVELML